MSNLKEQYDALVAAGMPEHPRLRVAPKQVWYDTMIGVSGLNEYDARDLITCHALRWFVKRCTKEAASVGLWHDPEWLHWTMDVCSGDESGLYENTDILDAIVQAVTA